MTWLERLSTKVKIKILGVVVATSLIFTYLIIIISMFINAYQGKPPIVETILLSLIQVIQTIVSGMLGYAVSQNNNNTITSQPTSTGNCPTCGKPL